MKSIPTASHLTVVEEGPSNLKSGNSGSLMSIKGPSIGKGQNRVCEKFSLMWFALETSIWFLIDLKVPTFTGLKIYVTGASADKSGGDIGFQLFTVRMNYKSP